MSAWVTGHNTPGYLPEADTAALAEWSDAANVLTEEMKHYADTDDESVELPEDAFDDDQPSMRAHVDAILKDDGPTEGQDFQVVIEQNDGNSVVFWLQWSEDREPDEEN